MEMNIKATSNALASGLYDTAGKVTSAGEYSVSTLEGETDGMNLVGLLRSRRRKTPFWCIYLKHWRI